MRISINEIADMVGAQASTRCEISELMVDSRSVTNPAATLFVALTSPNNDGHHFLNELAGRGCRDFVVDRRHAADRSIAALGAIEGVNLLVVDDTLAALQQIGAGARRRSPARFVGVTGSRGKTTVKEMIFQALEPEMRVGRSPRSFNSQIGVPLSLWGLAADAQLAVIEAGVSQAGEMERLEAMIDPEVVIITDITDEHAEGFASREAKIAEKLLLARRAKAVIYNADDAEVRRQVELLEGKRLIGVRAGDSVSAIDNLHYVKALLAYLGFDEERIATMTGRCYAVTPRLQVVEGNGGSKLIVDELTPDLVSLRGALDFMNRRVGGDNDRVVLFASEAYSADFERMVKLAASFGVTRLMSVGPGGQKLREVAGRVAPAVDVMVFTTVNELIERLSPDFFGSSTVLIEGRPGDGLDAVFSMLEAKQHETVMEVNLDAMIHNFNFFRSKVRPTTGVICMLKAHGYGAGSIELARTLQSQGAAYLAVAVVDEGVELRLAGITMPIIVLNPRAQNHRMMFRYRLEPEIYSLEMLDEVIADARLYGVKDFPVHIKLETGMRRLGFVEDELDVLAARLSEVDEVRASTFFSHLSSADDVSEDDYTRGQFAAFERYCDHLDRRLPYTAKRHILNSTGIARFPEMQYDFVRLGIGLYGIPTIFDGSESALRPVSSLSSVIISIKRWKAGDTVGYNRRGRLERDSVIATVPIGYADGLDRHLGNGRSEMVVNGKRCPTVGNICMDICMIDVTDAECRVGDRVEVFGPTVTAIELADRLGTIPYEILTSISPRVKRVYFRE